MRYILLLTSTTMLILLFSCSNETDEIIQDQLTETIEYLIIDSTMITYTFTDNLNTVVYSSLFGSIQPNLKIDINGDDIDDIEFLCDHYYHTVYDEKWASLKTLNDSIRVDTETHTTFIANYFKKIPSMSENDSIIRYYRENYNSTNEYPDNLKIDTLKRLYPVVYSYADTIRNQSNWKTGDFLLKSDDNSWGVATNVKMGIWRDINRKFIGLRFLDKDQDYYGWIELSIKDYKITLHKTACKQRYK